MNTDMNNRIGYLDFFKGIAIIIVFIGHFISNYHEEWLFYEKTLLLKWADAKMGVAIFAVILGFFAYSKGKKAKNLAENVLNRYIYFVICGFLINTLNVLVLFYQEGWETANIFVLFKQSITLGEEIFPTFWCMKFFFLGSIISYLNGAVDSSVLLILLEMVAFEIAFDNPWIGVCLMGNLMWKIINSNNSKSIWINKWALLILCIISYLTMPTYSILYSRYYHQGIVVLFFICLINRCSQVKKFMDKSIIRYVGRVSMSIYLLHVFTYTHLGGFLFSVISIDNWKVLFLVCMILCFAITVGVACLINGFLFNGSKIITEFILNTISKRILTGKRR